MEIQISSLNVRGIGYKQKRSELFNWLRSKNFPFTYYKRYTAATIQYLFGLRNGATSHFLAVVQVQKVESLFSLTTTFLSKFFGYIWTQMADLLSVTLKLKGDVLPWLLCTPQTKMNPAFSKTFLII